ncbi:hypothetical protein C943_01033 [Mariniradius saccharolyticus AK6]|uniref:Uncharacterized protein n=1 Tax=Mariniradius saccharolyticus AK6 TaxID=1239962 RepID=M7X5E1_9BACT|nr:hypothetical protein C943_01033 [Mariniradius saccharolyticus AK6]
MKSGKWNLSLSHWTNHKKIPVLTAGIFFDFEDAGLVMPRIGI